MKVLEFIGLSLLFTIGVFLVVSVCGSLLFGFIAFIDWDLSIFIKVWDGMGWKGIRGMLVLCYLIGLILTVSFIQE